MSSVAMRGGWAVVEAGREERPDSLYQPKD